MSTTTAFAELQRIIAQRNGVLTPADVVEEARPEGSVLHAHFEWDDSVAAEQYRLVQARDLIRRVTVTVSNASGEPSRVRAFVHVATTPEDDDSPVSHYRRIEDVAHNEVERTVFLAQMDAEWRAFRARWRTFSEALAALVAADFEDVA